MKRKILILIIIIIILIGGWFLIDTIFDIKKSKAESEARKKQEQQIQDMIKSRIEASLEADDDPFGDDNIVRVLLIGIDSRIGDTHGHCDAIQMIEINKEKDTINIIAVPRGTYVPLPGSGYKPSDYYVSNSCGLVSLEYGIDQIEKISGKKADFVVLVGFSRAMGIIRNLGLPTIETMQWLRNRQSFAIGEPQRAHNHSTFIKEMMLKYSSDEKSAFDNAWMYLMYKMVDTDLSFSQAKNIAEEVLKMNIDQEDWRIQLTMRPAYEVTDIPYDEENLDEQLKRLIQPIVHLLPEVDYSGETDAEIQTRLLASIEEGMENNDFVVWAFDNQLWLQVEDVDRRNFIHFDMIEKYTNLLDDNELSKQILTEYILEMDNRGLTDWQEKGEELLKIYLLY